MDRQPHAARKEAARGCAPTTRDSGGQLEPVTPVYALGRRGHLHGPVLSRCMEVSGRHILDTRHVR